MTNRLEDRLFAGKRSTWLSGELPEIKWLRDANVGECEEASWADFWGRSHWPQPTTVTPAECATVLYGGGALIYNPARAWANEARLAAMQFTMRHLLEHQQAEREEQALVESVRTLTEELFGVPATTRRVEDVGESPYTTLIVRVPSGSSSKSVVDMHERWVEAILDKSPAAIGKVRLNVKHE